MLDRRERHVHDRRVEHDHELRHTHQNENEPPVYRSTHPIKSFLNELCDPLSIAVTGLLGSFIPELEGDIREVELRQKLPALGRAVVAEAASRAVCALRAGCFRGSGRALLGRSCARTGAARVADRGLPARSRRRPPLCGEGAQARRPPPAGVGEIALPRGHRRRATLLARPRRQPLHVRAARRDLARRRRRPSRTRVDLADRR
jgi:hypothetical protein